MKNQHERKIANLLLIDDSPIEFKLAKTLLDLDKVNVNFTALHDGEKAVSFLQNQENSAKEASPDLIFLDINLPLMDGREILTAIKQDPSLGSIPVVMYSGSSATKDVEETQALGAVSYMEKPLNYQKLCDVVEQLPQFHLEEQGEDRFLYRIE